MTVPPNQGPAEPPPPYGGDRYGPPPQQRPGRRSWLIGGIIAAAAVLVAGAIVLVAFLAGRDDDEEPVVADETTSPTEAPTDEPEETTDPGDEFTGACLPYEPQVAGATVDASTPCDAPEAFWEITAWSDDVDATVSDGELDDNGPAYEVCGEDFGVFRPGELWTDWYYVYDPATGAVDYLYCIEALGKPDQEGRTPYVPDEGDCFDDSAQWWTVPCDSDLALYEVVGVVEFDDPRDLSDDEAAEEATCGGDLYWEVTTLDGTTSAILCGNEV